MIKLSNIKYHKTSFLINRFSKIFGAVVKGLGYIFHFFAPKFRFTIPEFSPAKIKPKGTQQIPRTLWQTNFTNHVSLPTYLNYLFNRLFSLSYDYRYISHESRENFIKQNASEREYKAFLRLNDGAAQADFWRVFILNKKGGVYLDFDANFCLPISWLINPESNELFLMTKCRFSNYFIASSPNNKVLSKTLEIIVENIENKRVELGIYGMTGPGALNTAIANESSVKHRHNRYTCVQGSFTNEHFSYIDRPKGKWIHKKNSEILKENM